MKSPVCLFAKLCCFALLLCFSTAFLYAQAGRRQQNSADDGGTILPVVAVRENGSEPIKAENLAFYENGIEQRIEGFSFDPSP